MFKPLFGLLFGLPFLGAGAMVLIVFAKMTTLECDRLEPQHIECSLISQGVFGRDTTIIPGGHLQGAEIDVNKDSEDGDTYRVVLRTETGNIPFTRIYSSGRSGKQEKVEQINTYLDNVNQKTLTIQQDDRILGYGFGGMLGVVGMVCMGSSLFSRR